MELAVIIEAIELVALPNAPVWQEKVYRARLSTGVSVDLFQTHWDVPLPPESLIGLSVQDAHKIRNAKMLAVAEGKH
jgi:hypothetical protein